MIPGPCLLGYSLEHWYYNVNFFGRHKRSFQALQGISGILEELLPAPPTGWCSFPHTHVHVEEGKQRRVGVPVPSQQAFPVLFVKLLLPLVVKVEYGRVDGGQDYGQEEGAPWHGEQLLVLGVGDPGLVARQGREKPDQLEVQPGAHCVELLLEVGQQGGVGEDAAVADVDTLKEQYSWTEANI